MKSARRFTVRRTTTQRAQHRQFLPGQTRHGICGRGARLDPPGLGNSDLHQDIPHPPQVLDERQRRALKLPEVPHEVVVREQLVLQAGLVGHRPLPFPGIRHQGDQLPQQTRHRQRGPPGRPLEGAGLAARKVRKANRRRRRKQLQRHPLGVALFGKMIPEQRRRCEPAADSRRRNRRRQWSVVTHMLGESARRLQGEHVGQRPRGVRRVPDAEKLSRTPPTFDAQQLRRIEGDQRLEQVECRLQLPDHEAPPR